MYPYYLDRKLHKTGLVQISGVRDPFHKLSIKCGPKTAFWTQNPHFGHTGPDGTRYNGPCD